MFDCATSSECWKIAKWTTHASMTELFAGLFRRTINFWKIVYVTFIVCVTKMKRYWHQTPTHPSACMLEAPMWRLAAFNALLLRIKPYTSFPHSFRNGKFQHIDSRLSERTGPKPAIQTQLKRIYFDKNPTSFMFEWASQNKFRLVNKRSRYRFAFDRMRTAYTSIMAF